MAAKIVTKGMSNDFLFEKGQDMKEVSCRNYEVDTSIALNEEFGFYLFPIGNETDLNTVLDSGCSHEDAVPFLCVAECVGWTHAVHAHVRRSWVWRQVLQPCI